MKQYNWIGPSRRAFHLIHISTIILRTLWKRKMNRGFFYHNFKVKIIKFLIKIQLAFFCSSSSNTWISRATSKTIMFPNIIWEGMRILHKVDQIIIIKQILKIISIVILMMRARINKNPCLKDKKIIINNSNNNYH